MMKSCFVPSLTTCLTKNSFCMMFLSCLVSGTTLNIEQRTKLGCVTAIRTWNCGTAKMKKVALLTFDGHMHHVIKTFKCFKLVQDWYWTDIKQNITLFHQFDQFVLDNHLSCSSPQDFMTSQSWYFILEKSLFLVAAALILFSLWCDCTYYDQLSH